MQESYQVLHVEHTTSICQLFINILNINKPSPVRERFPTAGTRPGTGTWRSYNRDQTIFQLDY